MTPSDEVMADLTLKQWEDIYDSLQQLSDADLRKLAAMTMGFHAQRSGLPAGAIEYSDQGLIYQFGPWERVQEVLLNGWRPLDPR